MAPQKKAFVYMITCKPTGCSYIGKSLDPDKRLRSHLAESLKSRSSHLPFYRAIKKYGNDAFEMTVIQECDSESEAYDAEREWILKFQKEGQPLYNRSSGGLGNFSPTDDTRERMSRAQKGKIVTQEQRQKISATLSGRKIPKEIVEKISAKLKGRKVTGKALENMKEGAKKRSQNPEWIEKNRLACLENQKKTRTPECRAQISKTQRKYTDEQALKVRESYLNGQNVGDLIQGLNVSVGTFYRMIACAEKLSGVEPGTTLRQKTKS